MKKIIKVFTAISTLLSIGTPSVYANNITEVVSDPIPIFAEVVVTDMETGESESYVEIIEPEVQKQMTRSATDSTTVSAGYEVLVELDDDVPKIVPRTTQGNSKTSGGIKATANVTFNVTADKEKIRVTHFSGSWTPTASIYYVTNRYARLKDCFIGHTWTSYPTTNSFSRTTGWGYVDHIGGDVGAWAYTECYGNVSDMPGTHKITISFGFNGF